MTSKVFASGYQRFLQHTSYLKANIRKSSNIEFCLVKVTPEFPYLDLPYQTEL